MKRTSQYGSWISAIRRREVRPLSSFAALLLVALCSWTTATAQIIPSGDAYTNTATPTINLGTKSLLDVRRSR